MPLVVPSLFDQSRRSDFLHLPAYRPNYFDAFVLKISTKRQSSFAATNFDSSSSLSTLGDFDALLIEVLDMVIQTSDLHIVAAMRLLSRRGRQVVDNSAPYRWIMLYAPSVVVALTKVEVASQFTVNDVFRVLRTSVCAIYGQFGTFLWIPECIRCCMRCLYEAPALMPMIVADAEGAFKLTKRTLAQLPVILSVPGSYTSEQRRSKSGDAFSVKNICTKLRLKLMEGSLRTTLMLRPRERRWHVKNEWPNAKPMHLMTSRVI